MSKLIAKLSNFLHIKSIKNFYLILIDIKKLYLYIVICYSNLKKKILLLWKTFVKSIMKYFVTFKNKQYVSIVTYLYFKNLQNIWRHCVHAS